MMVKPATQDERFGARGYGNGLLDGETRKAMNAAFEAMSEWREEMAATAERQSGKVFDKMGAAAKAAGWPEALVEATKSNMQQMSKLQLGMIDQIMDAWTEQMKSPGKFTFGNAFAKGFPGLPGSNSAGLPTATMPGFPQMDLAKYGFGSNPMAPFQFWMEAGQMWQKQWADAMAAMMSGMPGNPLGTPQQEPAPPRKATSFR